MSDKFIVLFVFIVYGGVGVFRPEWIARMQVWTNKKILGAKFIPSQRTLNWYRGMGVLFWILAVVMMFAD